MSVGEKHGRQVTRSAMLSLSEDQGSTLTLETLSLRGWKSNLIAELNRSPVRKRLSIAMAGVACINLVTFITCQVIYVPDGRADFRHPLLWLLELVAILAFLRKSLGRGWIRSSTAINLVGQVLDNVSHPVVQPGDAQLVHGLRAGMVQTGLGDPEHVPVRVPGLGLLTLVFCPGSADVGDRTLDGQLPALGFPDLWRFLVAGAHGHSH